MARPSTWQALADAVLASHVAIVAFVVLGLALILVGGARQWRWVRAWSFRLAHVAAIGIVVAESWLDIECPLTTLERALRTRAGVPTDQAGFVQHWLQALLFFDAPAWVFTAGYTAFGLLVAAAWWRVPPRAAARAGRSRAVRGPSARAVDASGPRDA